MSSSVGDLLIEQSATIASLKRVIVNFKKLAKPNVTLPKTQSRLSTLEDLWSTCRNLHIKLLQTATEEQQTTLPYFQKEEFLVAEDCFHETADLLQETISRFNRTSVTLYDRSTDSSTRESSNNCVQLPRIALPKFSGKLTEWENFRNIFESFVANNDSLSNSQKFHYLKTSVHGDAALIISE